MPIVRNFPKPDQIPGTYLGTYSDLVDHVTIVSGGSNQAKQQFLIRRAVESAYRRVVVKRDWKYFFNDFRINTQTPYSTGTITYVNSTRVLTLSGGTWPSWAASGRLLIGSVISQVDSITNSTNVVLSQELNPGQDISTATSFTLYQNLYPVPGDFRRLRGAVTSNNVPLQHLEPTEFVILERRLRNAGQPVYYSLWPDEGAYNQMCFALYPYPGSLYTIDIPYQRFARRMFHSGYGTSDSVGTVSNTGAVVTGSGTKFTADMAGCVLRFSNTSTVPTGTVGVSPYVEQQIVLSVASTTTLTLTQAPTGTYSGLAYQVSDPVDVPEYIYDALLTACEAQVAALMKQPTADVNERARVALIEALESDNQLAYDPNSPGGGWMLNWYTLAPPGVQRG